MTKIKFRAVIYSFLVLFVLSFVTSCVNDNKIFSRDELELIDSLYKLELSTNKEKLDSVCDSIYQSNYVKMVDSIKEVRKREILDLLKK